MSVKVNVLVYQGCMASEVMAVADMFHIANKLGSFQNSGKQEALFACELISVGEPLVVAANGVRISAKKVRRADGDLLLVPGFDFDDARILLDRLKLLEPEISFVREAEKRHMRVASMCVGAFVLAEAGILDHRSATTSWLLNGVLAKRYPLVKLDLNAMVTEDRGVYCAGAVTAAYDLGLKLIEQFGNRDLAQRVAKVMLLEPNRRSQAPFVLTSLDAQSKDLFVTQVSKWLRKNFRNEISIDQLAARFAISERTLLRRFRGEMQDTPLGYLQKIRLEHAKALLETTDLSFSHITAQAGYFDESTFRRLFKKHVGLTPVAYQKRFSIRTPRQRK